MILKTSWLKFEFKLEKSIFFDNNRDTDRDTKVCLMISGFEDL